MLVYIIINTITERCYVGSTRGTLKARVGEHWKQAYASGQTDAFHKALRDWPERELWLDAVLVNCSSLEEMELAEAAWIRNCSADESGIGYNSRSMDGHLIRALSPQEIGRSAWKNARAARPKTEMSEEQREFYRECGKKGARRRSEMSEEERERYRAWGRKGAERSKAKRALLA
jgi:general stress protein YciG